MRGPGRPRKDATASVEAPAATTPPAGTSVDFGPANAGDVDGTAYFVCDAHNTVAKFAPTESLGPVSDKTKWVQVTGAEYLGKQKALAERFPSAQTPTAAPSAPTAAPAQAAAPAVSATPTSTPATHSYGSVRAACIELVKAGDARRETDTSAPAGRDLLVPVLERAGVKSVPQLADVAPDVLVRVAADVAAAMAPKAAEVDPLFG